MHPDFEEAEDYTKLFQRARGKTKFLETIIERELSIRKHGKLPQEQERKTKSPNKKIENKLEKN